MRGEFYLFVATIVAAIGWVASKSVLVAVPGEVFIASRFLLSSVILLPFCYKKLLSLTVNQLKTVLAVGLILALSMQVWVHAMSTSESISEGAFIMSLAMIIAPFTAWVLFRTRPNRAFKFALPFAITGLALLMLTKGWNIDNSQWYFLFASALLSVHFVLNKKLANSIDPFVSIFLQLLITGLMAAVIALFSPSVSYQLSSSVLIWFAVSVMIATSLRYIMQTVGQHLVNTESAALIMILEPIWTLMLSIALLGETLAPQKLIGGGIIFLSLLLYIKLSKL